MAHDYGSVKLHTDSCRSDFTHADFAARLSRVTENGSPPEPGQVPEVRKTVDQIVAWNIAYFRRAAGLTQGELGELIGGRPKRSVSADERSWDGGHTREFNAQQIVALAVALGVPVVAFFLPPDDDGTAADYLFRPYEGHGDLRMADLMAYVVPDSDDDTPAMKAYRERFLTATRTYQNPSWTELMQEWFDRPGEEEQRAEKLRIVQSYREVMLAVAGDFGEFINANTRKEK